jgi:hypothetical protein
MESLEGGIRGGIRQKYLRGSTALHLRAELDSIVSLHESVDLRHLLVES